MIPYNRPWLDNADRLAVQNVLSDTWLTTGPRVAAFERDLGNYVQNKNCLVVASGSAALFLALKTLDLAQSCVIVPAITFSSAAIAVIKAHCEPCFADCDALSGLMELKHIEQAYQRAKKAKQIPKAVIVTHLAGRMPDMEAIAAWCQKHNLAVIEDACHAFGGRYPDGSPVGSCRYARVVCVSFHPVKTITTTEGGALFCKHREDVAHLKRLRHHGIVPQQSPAKQPYDIVDQGWNERLSDVACALGQSQLKKIDRFVAIRQSLAQNYLHILEGFPKSTTAWKCAPCGHERQSSWHLFQIHLSSRIRNRVRSRMQQQGIQTQCHYPALHRFTYYTNRLGEISLAGAQSFASTTLSLPLYVGLRPSQQKKIVGALHACVND